MRYITLRIKKSRNICSIIMTHGVWHKLLCTIRSIPMNLMFCKSLFEISETLFEYFPTTLGFKIVLQITAYRTDKGSKWWNEFSPFFLSMKVLLLPVHVNVFSQQPYKISLIRGAIASYFSFSIYVQILTSLGLNSKYRLMLASIVNN